MGDEKTIETWSKFQGHRISRRQEKKASASGRECREIAAGNPGLGWEAGRYFVRMANVVKNVLCDAANAEFTWAPMFLLELEGNAIAKKAQFILSEIFSHLQDRSSKIAFLKLKPYPFI